MSAVDRERFIDGLTRCVRDRPEILEAYIFGSHARGQAQVHSDLDAAVYVDPARVTMNVPHTRAEVAAAVRRMDDHDRAHLQIDHRNVVGGFSIGSLENFHLVIEQGARLAPYVVAPGDRVYSLALHALR